MVKVWGNAFPPPIVFSPKHSPNLSFQKTQPKPPAGPKAKLAFPHLSIFTFTTAYRYIQKCKYYLDQTAFAILNEKINVAFLSGMA